MTTLSAPAWRGAIALAFWVLHAGGASASEGVLQPYAEPAPPAVSLTGLAGERQSTDAARGEVLLLHFFATWCEPCRPELASLDRLVTEAGGRGLKVLAVSVAEPPVRVARFFKSEPVRFPVALDEDRAAARAWKIDALPSTIVIDRSGRPRLAARRDLDWRDPAVVRALELLLAEAGGPITSETALNGPEGGK